MILFDSYPKQLAGPRDPNISQYEYINRSKRNEYADLRERAERWAGRFPIDEEFLGRFKGKKDRHHQAAFFELFMHEFLMRLGYQVKRGEPMEDERKTAVDFCVSKGNEPIFCLECTLAQDSMTDPSVERIKAQIEKAINEVASPDFYLYVDYLKTSSREPNKRKIKEAVRRLLNQGYSKRYGFVWDNDWNIRLTLSERSPKSKERNNPLTVGSSSSGLFINKDPHGKLMNALMAKKTTKYGEFKLPYIIAVNTSELILDDQDIARILFGFNPDHTAVYPRKEGFFHNGQPINTGVSGVILFSNLWYMEMNPLRSEFWDNPWADKMLRSEYDLWIDRVKFECFKEQFEVYRTPGGRVSELMLEN